MKATERGRRLQVVSVKHDGDYVQVEGKAEEVIWWLAQNYAKDALIKVVIEGS